MKTESYILSVKSRKIMNFDISENKTKLFPIKLNDPPKQKSDYGIDSRTCLIFDIIDICAAMHNKKSK